MSILLVVFRDVLAKGSPRSSERNRRTGNAHALRFEDTDGGRR